MCKHRPINLESVSPNIVEIIERGEKPIVDFFYTKVNYFGYESIVLMDLDYINKFNFKKGDIIYLDEEIGNDFDFLSGLKKMCIECIDEYLKKYKIQLQKPKFD